MLSADCYAEVVLPYEREVLQAFPNGGMIHLCGTYAQHIPVWHAFVEHRALQVNDVASTELPLHVGGLPGRVFYNLECREMS